MSPGQSFDHCNISGHTSQEATRAALEGLTGALGLSGFATRDEVFLGELADRLQH